MKRGIAALALLVCACSGGGSETGNPVAAEIALSLRTSDERAVALSSGAAGTVIEEAWVAFGEISFLDPEQCAQIGDLDVEGETRLIANLAEPGVVLSLEVPERSYCGLVAPVENDNPELADTDALRDHSIVIRGEREDGTAFLLRHSEQDELELAADEGSIEVSSGGPPLILAFDVATWMAGVDLEGAQVAGDGTIAIDITSNRALLDQFEVNLECSLELYEDSDGDGLVTGADRRLAHCAVD
jgi:hypothetical protein